MKRTSNMKKAIPIMAAAATLFGAAISDAALTLGPTNATTKFPQYLTDPNGLKLQLCLDSRNPANPEAGPCFFEKKGGKIIEAAYWMAEGTIDDTPYKRVMLIMGIEAEVIPAGVHPVDPEEPIPAPEAVGPTLINLMRFRMEPGATPLQTGNYLVTTPFGAFTVPVAEGTPKQDPDGIDVLVGRDATGALVVGMENFVSAADFAAGAQLDGPVSFFPKAFIAPPGFVGDGAELLEAPEPGVKVPKNINPGPEPTGPQVLVGGGVVSAFTVLLPDGTTIGSPAAATFSVQGSIYESANAAASGLTATVGKIAKKKAAEITVTSPEAGVATAAAFGPQLETTVDANLDGVTELDVPAATPAIAPAGTLANFPRRVVFTPTAGGETVVAQVTDALSGTVKYNFKPKAGNGVLTIRMNSGFDKLAPKDRPKMTATIGGVEYPLNPAGNKTIPKFVVPEGVTDVTVTSSTGGSVVIPITGLPAAPAPL